jgi:hypothetical protein
MYLSALHDGPDGAKLMREGERLKSRRFGDQVKDGGGSEATVPDTSRVVSRTLVGDGEGGEVLQPLQKGEDFVRPEPDGANPKLSHVAQSTQCGPPVLFKDPAVDGVLADGD